MKVRLEVGRLRRCRFDLRVIECVVGLMCVGNLDCLLHRHIHTYIARMSCPVPKLLHLHLHPPRAAFQHLPVSFLDR